MAKLIGRGTSKTDSWLQDERRTLLPSRRYLISFDGKKRGLCGDVSIILCLAGRGEVFEQFRWHREMAQSWKPMGRALWSKQFGRIFTANGFT
jgi:hypothetical protein